MSRFLNAASSAFCAFGLVLLVVGLVAATNPSFADPPPMGPGACACINHNCKWYQDYLRCSLTTDTPCPYVQFECVECTCYLDDYYYPLLVCKCQP